MKPAPSLKIPFDLLALDFVGVLLLALGVLEGFTDKNLVPEALKFEHYPWVLIVAGLLLMAPLLLHIIRFVTKSPKDPRERDVDI